MTTPTIERRAFLDATRGREMSTEATALDPRLAGAGLEAADRNGDGAIRGETELDALFDLLTRAGPRPHGRRRISPTMLAGVADRMGAPALRPATDAVRNAVLEVALNDTGVDEATALRRNADVLLVGDLPSRRDLVALPDGRRFDLAAAVGVRDFVHVLALPNHQEQRLTAVLLIARPGARRELGELARIWSAAHRGEAIPARLMLSGHGDGFAIFGDDGDRLDDQDIVRLAQAMPEAAAQVRALHVAACQHGYEPRMAPFIDAFPNLDSVWAYAGFSPSGPPAQRQQAIWERGTRGLPSGGGELRRADARGLRRGDAVRVWTQNRGFDGPPLRELRLIETDMRRLTPLYDDLMAGRLPMNPARLRQLTELYELLQESTTHPDFREQNEASFQAPRHARRQSALRLRFFPKVAARFAQVHAAVIRRGYEAVGLEPPDFANLSRPEVLRAITDLEARARDDTPAVTQRLTRLLRRGLIELRPRDIPVEWI